MKKDGIMFFAIMLMALLLKLSNVPPFNNIDWLWILSPLWVTGAIGLVFFLLKKKLN